jgi:hypothetical protein
MVAQGGDGDTDRFGSLEDCVMSRDLVVLIVDRNADHRKHSLLPNQTSEVSYSARGEGADCGGKQIPARHI